jgi:hypothetical protein
MLLLLQGTQTMAQLSYVDSATQSGSSYSEMPTINPLLLAQKIVLQMKGLADNVQFFVSEIMKGLSSGDKRYVCG